MLPTMNPTLIATLRKTFEEYSQTVDSIEFWYARDLQKLLDYDKWENFAHVIEKAKVACKNSNQNEEDHFAGVRKMVQEQPPKRLKRTRCFNPLKWIKLSIIMDN